MTDEMLGELMAVVGMANETNRLADGYQVEVDAIFQVGRLAKTRPRAVCTHIAGGPILASEAARLEIRRKASQPELSTARAPSWHGS